jgi:DnaJ domain
MTRFRDQTEGRALILLVIFLPLGSIAAVFLAPYGTATISNCRVEGFLEFCGTLKSGSTLFQYTSQASSEFTLTFAGLAVELALTLVSTVAVWVVASPRSAGRGVTGWATITGLFASIGPWLGLAPTWGYWLITACFWASLVSAYLYRDGLMFERDRAWDAERRAAEEEARRAREEERQAQKEWFRRQQEAAERARQDYEGRFNGEREPPRGTTSRRGTVRSGPSRSVLDAAALLGVSASDSVDVIDAAYMSWAKLLHPDVNPITKDATKQMQRVNHAKDVLLEYARRRSPD